jgi:hypothetical protein
MGQQNIDTLPNSKRRLQNQASFGRITKSKYRRTTKKPLGNDLTESPSQDQSKLSINIYRTL